MFTKKIMKFGCKPVVHLSYLAFATVLHLSAFIIFAYHENILSATGWILAFSATLGNAVALYQYIRFQNYAKNTVQVRAPFLYSFHPTKADLEDWYTKQISVIIVAAIASPVHLFCAYLIIDCIIRHLPIHGDVFNNQWTAVGAFLIACKSIDMLLLYVYRKYASVYAEQHRADSPWENGRGDLSPLNIV